MSSYYANYLKALSSALDSVEVCSEAGERISPAEALSILCDRTQGIQKAGRFLYFCGNGASAAMASHMAADWTKNAGVKSGTFTDVAGLTAFANDTGYDNVFAGPLRMLAVPGDALAAVSSSGNSPSVIKAVETARELGLFVATFTGFRADNRCRALGEVNFYLPTRTYGITESAHQVILHAWLDQFMRVREWETT